MSESAARRRKRYVNRPKDIYKHTCLIRVPRYSSDGCKFLGEFGSKYSKRRPTKARGNDHVTRNKFNRQQDNNAIVNYAVDGIFLQEKMR